MIGDPFEMRESYDEKEDDVERDLGLSVIQPVAKMKIEGMYLIAEISMPGVRRDDISISLKRNKVSVYADKMEIKVGGDEGFFASIRNSKCFKLSESLPVTIIPEKADVRYDNGILRIQAPLDVGGDENVGDITR